MLTKKTVDQIEKDILEGKSTVKAQQVIDLCSMVNRLAMLLKDTMRKEPVALNTANKWMEKFADGEVIHGLYETIDGGKNGR